MALSICKECGSDVSTKAASCPNCGAVLKKKTGCLGFIGAGFLILIVLGLISSLMNDGPTTSGTSSRAPSSAEGKGSTTVSVRTEGESVHVGYTSYAVWRSWWSNRLSDNQFLDQRPNATYLFVELTVRNNDRKARIVPPLELVDEDGAEYEASSNGWAVEGAIGILESLNPSVSKQGFIIFDVPRERSYKLKLSGGFWSSEDAYVQLAPKATR